MDYLLLNGRKVCAIKLKERSGRVRLDPTSRVSFPRKINFWCSKRPLPDLGYEIKLRGVGVARLNIRSVGSPGYGNFDVYADVISTARVPDAPIRRAVSRNRRIPGRATGYISFVISWPSGTQAERCAYCTSLESAIRLFKRRLQIVPSSEGDMVTAHFDAEVRKAGGGCRRVPLASWDAGQSLPDFFRGARRGWERLPKEHDDDVSASS